MRLTEIQRKYYKEERKRLGISLSQLSDLTGKSISYVQRFFSEQISDEVGNQIKTFIDSYDKVKMK